MDINDLKKLKKLKEEGLITDEEFKSQKQSYLNSFNTPDKPPKHNENKQKDQNLNSDNALLLRRLLKWCGVGVFFYFFVVFVFPYSITCQDGVSNAACNCLKSTLSKNVPFFDKIRFIFIGSEEGEFGSYISGDSFPCLLMEDDEK